MEEKNLDDLDLILAELNLKLKESNFVENSWRELRLIVAYVTKTSYEKTFLDLKNVFLNAESIELIKKYVKQRCDGKPLAKILGYKDFWNNRFLTNEYTLDPRPDSETLIESILKNIPDKNLPLKILDLGTGTGCLLLTLIDEYKNAIGFGVDICDKALEIAKKNAHNLSLDSRISLQKSNWFENIKEKNFDIIISNPPYIDENIKLDIPTLYDPHLALFAKNQGLENYENILVNAKKFLKKNGNIYLEVGYDQSEKVQSIFEKNKFTNINLAKDISGTVRMVFATY